MKHLTCLTILAIASWTYGQAQSLIGEWRHVNSPITYDTSGPQKRRIGDWIFSRDSTFTVIGVDSKKLDTVPGWHTGGTLKGTWKIKDTNRLELYGEDYPIPLSYQIFRLNKNELYLASDLGFLLKFTRVTSR